MLAVYSVYFSNKAFKWLPITEPFKYEMISLTHSHTMTPLGKKPFENIVGKGEIARYPVRIVLCHFRQI